MVDVRSGITVATLSERVEAETDLWTAIERVATRTVDAVEGLSAALPRVAALEPATTVSLEALRVYSLSGAPFARGDWPAARALLERALEHDPTFAMAHARLGLAYSNEGRNVRAAEHLRAAQRQGAALSDFERHYAAGHLATTEGDYDRALREFTLLMELFPNHFLGYYNVGITLARLRNGFGRCVDVLEIGLGRVEGGRHAGSLRSLLAYCQLGAEQIEDARTTAWPSPIGPAFLARLALGQYEALESLMATWTTDPRMVSRRPTPRGGTGLGRSGSPAGGGFGRRACRTNPARAGERDRRAIRGDLPSGLSRYGGRP